MAEMQLTTDDRFKLTYEMRVPQIIELLDMSEQTLQKVDGWLYSLTLLLTGGLCNTVRSYHPSKLVSFTENKNNNWLIY